MSRSATASATATRSRSRLGQSITRTGATLLDRFGFLQRRFRARGARRIICYHGVIADEHADKPWAPSYFVTQSQFAEHMATLARFGEVVRLADVCREPAVGAESNRPSIAITFDDVAAGAFHLARPILARHGYRASFYVSTGHATTGRLFDADVLQWLRFRPEMAIRTGAMGPLLRALISGRQCHKRLALSQVRSALGGAESLVRTDMGEEAVQALRPMNWREIRTLAEEGHEIGGHTVDHAILARQDATVRRRQIEECVATLAEQLGGAPPGFAYPNGGPGDFDQTDGRILESLGVCYAVSTRPGFHDGRSDPFALPRVCIGMGHTTEKLALELSGLLDRRRLRRQGWITR
jgi:peptidoglycan/xylan/chitin deacetylase (PgdA/CDA1 family)